MKLYIDESGNTGEIIQKNFSLNFKDQPAYVTASILLADAMEVKLTEIIMSLTKSHKIQGDELKAKNLFESHPAFVGDLIKFISSERIPYFIELTDKFYYTHIHIVENFIIPTRAFPINQEVINAKSRIASTIGEILNPNVYEQLFLMLSKRSNLALEKFFDFLIKHFISLHHEEHAEQVRLTQRSYLKLKKENSQIALDSFLPIPDKTPHGKLIHLLPNYNSFSNLIARAQKFVIENTLQKGFQIIHDDQKQFGGIFQDIVNNMKHRMVDRFVGDIDINKNAEFNLSKNVTLEFLDSKTTLPLQVADLLAGFVMRYWVNFTAQNHRVLKNHSISMSILNDTELNPSVGINYVVPDQLFVQFQQQLYRC